ncbi:acyl--CoA ligase [Sphingobium sp. H33]|uniref:Acyl--CoA ligase n=2 Tax=Sphingobium nicotianae TaxID=2782607 RepID=A0A9X1DEP7_9SPHN|nr:class I adenylate-forming enzyme family protein [Sphingobium nicotianae]MBT2188558.1 acyl--CoA ligase [Sphingobium nicotianae]
MVITAPDGPLPVGQVTARGALYPGFVAAPPDLPRFFAHFCAEHGERTCLVDGAERLSFAQVHALARRLAAGLIAHHGVTPGEPVGLAGRNGAGWIVAYMGIVMAGGVATLINAFWTGPEMAAAVRDVGCRLVLADRFRHDALVARGEESGARPILLDLDIPVAEALAPLCADPADITFPAPGPDAPATILFTSGSTGQSKGALSDHRAKVQAVLNFACNGLCVATLLAQRGTPADPAPATLLNLPLFHVTGEVVVMLQSFVLGRKMVVMRRWDVPEALRLIEAERVTYVTGVPLMGLELATHGEREGFDLSSLSDLAAGGAPRPAEHVERIRASLPNIWPSFGFGLTETNAVGTGIVRETCLAYPHSPGRATAPLVDLAIFGEDHAVLDTGEVGEVGIRALANISGYWKRAADNAALFTPSGHVLTGDLGNLDADGYLTIVGRSKDIIIRGGENIACPEVEAALYAIADVRECAVFGIPDARLGEVSVAVVHLDAASGLDERMIGEALNGRLAAYKRPSRILLHDAPLPRLGSEKIDKRALRETYLAG